MRFLKEIQLKAYLEQTEICDISYIIKLQRCNLADMWVNTPSTSRVASSYTLATNATVWASGKVGLRQSNFSFILLSHYTKWYYVDRDKCSGGSAQKWLCSEVNLISWLRPRFSRTVNTAQIYSLCRKSISFLSRVCSTPVICHIYHMDYQHLDIKPLPKVKGTSASRNGIEKEIVKPCTNLIIKKTKKMKIKKW